MLSLHALRYAESAARLKSFSAAARECGVSQPTVSASIADLELFLGAPLFLRTGRQLELTIQGVRLLPRVQAVLQAIEALRVESDGLASEARTELRIGFTPLVGAARMAQLLEPFMRTNPQTSLLFFESSVSELQQRLDEGDLNVIFGYGFLRTRARKRLVVLRDRLVFCSNAGASEPTQDVSVERASQTKLVLTEDMCGLASFTRKLFQDQSLSVSFYSGRAMSYNALEDWVRLGLGSAIMPVFHVANAQLASGLVDATGSPVMLNSEAVWRAQFASTSHGAEFLTYLHRLKS